MRENILPLQCMWYCGKRFNTATKRTTHEMNIKNSKVKADFGRFKIITINIQPDYLITLEDKVEHITDILIP